MRSAKSRSSKRGALSVLYTALWRKERSANDFIDSSDSEDDQHVVVSEGHIVLLKYDAQNFQMPNKKETKRKCRKGRNKRNLKADDDEKVEAIVIDFHTPNRKLETESRIFLKKINMLVRCW